MNRSLVVFAILCAVSSIPSRPQSATTSSPTGEPRHASIVGVVSNSLTGKPLDEVHVQLIQLGANRQQSGPAYGAITRGNGSFSIAGIAPGKYMLSCERMGYVDMAPKRMKDMFVTVDTVSRLDLRLEMVPAVIISGHVLDEYGDPLPDFQVVVEPVEEKIPFAGIGSLGQATTDDRGEFRILARPGKYRLKVQAWSVVTGVQEIREDGSIAGNYHEAYYPGVADARAATTIELKAGEKRSGFEFHMAATPTLSISGSISGAENALFCGIHVMYGAAPDRMRSSSSVVATGNGKQDRTFVINNLDPGFYKILARCQTAEEKFYSQTESVVLTQSDVTRISLVLSPGYDVTGKLEVPGPEANSFQAVREVYLAWSESFAMPFSSSTEAAADGTFTFLKIAPGRYKVGVKPLPENGFVESIQLNGKVYRGPTVEIGEGNASLLVKLSTQGARLSGTLRNQDGDPIPLFATVFLLPVQTKPSEHDHDIVESRVDGNGKYEFKGVAPGKYRLFAREMSQEPFDAESAMRKAEDAAEIIELKPRDKIERDLKPWTQGERNAPKD